MVSGTVRFRFEQEPGMGFCASSDLAQTATITRTGAGEEWVTGSLWFPREDCSDSGLNGCMVVIECAPRLLDATAIASVEAAYAAVATTVPDTACQDTGDPCLVLRLEAEGTSSSTTQCASLSADWQDAQDVGRLLKTLLE